MRGLTIRLRRSRFLRFLLGVVAALVFSVGAAGSPDRGRSASGSAPMLGADLVWATCGPGNTPYIVPDYGRPGVRGNVVLALHAMRAAGLESFVLFLWPTHDATWEIPSAQGRLIEPYRTNLINLLLDIRSVGFEHLTVTFQPLRSNDMKGWTGVYNPARFEENWSFIRDVRPLVKEYGPASTHIDLLGEGAPSNSERAYRPVWWNDLTRMYRNYVEAFGNHDVTISTMAKGTENYGSTVDDVERMQNLIDLLRASGKPLPTFFALSVSYGSSVIDDLRAIDQVLSRNGLSQPLVISEAGYNNPDAAAAVAAFVRTSTRPLLELNEWPLYGPEILRGQRVVPPPRCASPPFRVDAYASALRGAPPSTTLRASVAAKGRLSLLTPYGHEVKALIAGTYTIIVSDSSAKHGFSLVGGSLKRSSGTRFKGTKTWTVTLEAFGAYTYRAVGPGGTHRHFDVLLPG